MIIYLSGIARGGSDPESHIKKPPIMLSYWSDVNQQQKIEKTNIANARLKQLLKLRKKTK